MDALDLLKTSDVELLHRADACLRQAGSALDTPPPYIDDAVRLRLFLEAHSYLSEILRRRAEKAAVDDKTREHRRFLTELFVIGGLIVVEIVLSVLGLSEGRQQATILEQMKTSTAKTAEAIQHSTDLLKILAEEQSASLKILQQQEADRLAQAAKKPRPALYVGNMPIDKATLQLAARTGLAQDTASFDLLVKNIGDAPVSTSRLHALTPKGVGLDAEQLIIVPQIGPPAHPNTQVLTLQLPVLPAGETYRLHIAIYAPKGHPAFKITFTVDAMELQAVAPLGSLRVLPPKL